MQEQEIRNNTYKVTERDIERIYKLRSSILDLTENKVDIMNDNGKLMPLYDVLKTLHKFYRR